MFPRRRKNLFHHLGVGVEPVLGSGPPPKDILVIQGRTKAAAETLVERRGSGNKKNLQKFLGVPAVPAARSCSTRKDLCSFLGVERGQLERAVSTVSSSGAEVRRLSSSQHWAGGGSSGSSCRDMRMMSTSRSDMSAVFDDTLGECADNCIFLEETVRSSLTDGFKNVCHLLVPFPSIVLYNIPNIVKHG